MEDNNSIKDEKYYEEKSIDLHGTDVVHGCTRGNGIKNSY